LCWAVLRLGPLRNRLARDTERQADDREQCSKHRSSFGAARSPSFATRKQLVHVGPSGELGPETRGAGALRAGGRAPTTSLTAGPQVARETASGRPPRLWSTAWT